MKDEIELILDKMAEVVELVGPETKYTDLYPNAERNEKFIRCNYLEDGQPGCLVGRVLALLGWSNGELADLLNRSVSTLSHYNQHKLSQDTWSVLCAAQIVQDDNQPWGKALEAAREQANNIRQAYGQ